MNWHARFTQQARWTEELRRYFYMRVAVKKAARILEVGCGTGALIAELPMYTPAAVYGLDISATHLRLAIRNAPDTHLACGDGHTLPYSSAAFDLTYCHFLLLWVKTPQEVVLEMKRVTRPGGAVLALAEPDYGGRVDYPFELVTLGEWQTSALRSQGAEPLTGRRLAGFFHQAGLEDIETGILGGQWSGKPSSDEHDSEWDVLQSDLADRVSPEELFQFHTLEETAWKRGERVLFVPTFYAWGIVPDRSNLTMNRR